MARGAITPEERHAAVANACVVARSAIRLRCPCVPCLSAGPTSSAPLRCPLPRMAGRVLVSLCGEHEFGLTRASEWLETCRKLGEHLRLVVWGIVDWPVLGVVACRPIHVGSPVPTRFVSIPTPESDPLPRDGCSRLTCCSSHTTSIGEEANGSSGGLDAGLRRAEATLAPAPRSASATVNRAAEASVVSGTSSPGRRGPESRGTVSMDR
jgi:hypothetical protein